MEDERYYGDHCQYTPNHRAEYIDDPYHPYVRFIFEFDDEVKNQFELSVGQLIAVADFAKETLAKYS